MAASVEKTKLTGVENFGTLEVDEDISSVCKLYVLIRSQYIYHHYFFMPLILLNRNPCQYDID